MRKALLKIPFYSPRIGKLTVTVQNDQFLMNFPADQFAETELTNTLISTTDQQPIAAYRGKTDYMLVFTSEEEILHMQPNLQVISTLSARGLIVTAPGKTADFVSRFFAPAVGVNEDPVCGSAHTTLTPWSAKLQLNEMRAAQLSARSGVLFCRLLNDRVELGGKAVLYLKGEIYI